MINRFSITLQNPAFARNSLPGLLTMPVKLANDAEAKRLFEHPQISANTGAVSEVPWSLEVGGLVWRVGKLKLLSGNEKELSVQFVSEAGAVKKLLEGTSLRDLDLGEPAFSDACVSGDLVYVAPEYGNPKAYGDDKENNPDYAGTVNKYENGAYLRTSATCQTPWVRLQPVLEQIAGLIGYRLTGSFVDDPLFPKLAIYSNVSLDGEADFEPAKLLPDVKLSKFLIELKKLFGIHYHFDTTAGTLELMGWKEILRADFEDWSDKVVKRSKFGAYDYAGVRFHQVFDSSDDMYGRAVSDFRTLEVDGGAEPYDTRFSTLAEVDGRITVSQEVYSVPKEQENRTDSLRLAVYGGLANGKPTASTEALRWRGTAGLANTRFAEWLEFRRQSRTEVFEMSLTVADLFNWRPDKRVMINHNIYVLEKIRSKIEPGLTKFPATVTARKANV
ncbi:hypothetical protein FUAX_55880 (plasmid) [Fulvitalea axinellae]|uniref:Uncharacterized protein n=1 Tax=Fulvitalea axinellae TaxID=1182444 RepID=A0AAU9CVR3_9BACT|nr:hypothetical protein FUAX_55880 [Fulvitalea axinellae]